MGTSISWRRMAGAFVVLMLLTLVTPIRPAAAASSIRVQLDGRFLQMDAAPVIENGRTLVPLRAIMEALGAEVSWDPATRTATVKGNGHTVILTVGNKTATMDGKTVQLDVPARIVADRTMVPVRFVVEATGGEVDWVAEQNTVAMAVLDESLKSRMRVEKAERTLPRDAPIVAKDAVTRGFKLLEPARGYTVADGVVHLVGEMGSSLEGDAILVELRQPRGRNLETAIAVKNGKFAGDIYLPDGAGEYVIQLFLPNAKGSDYVSKAVDLKVRNVSPAPTQGAFVTRQLFRTGLQIESPAAGHISEDTMITFSGRAPAALNGSALWFVTEGNKGEWDSYALIQDGKFSGQAYMGAGSGQYWVEVLLQRNKDSDFYDRIALIPVTNTNPKTVGRSVVILPTGMKRGLGLDPIVNVSQDGYMAISGRVAPGVKGSAVWVEEIAAGRKDDSIYIPIVDGRFSARVPLTLGQGAYVLRLYLPDLGYLWDRVAEIRVTNEGASPASGIEYHAVAFDLKVTVTTPQGAIANAGQSITLAGTVGTGPWTFPYIVVETMLGNLEAKYRVPIKDNRYEAMIPLRFGPGSYEVTLYQQTSNTSLEGIATFTAASTTAKDQRDLLPSFGIESDDPTIIALSRQLTEGKAGLEAGRAVYDWVAKNVSYDTRKANTRRVDVDEGALKTLQSRTGVCRDYAALAVALLRAAGIPAHMVTGTAGGDDHAWVEFKAGDHWVEMDPTYGAGSLLNFRFVAKYDPAYFDPEPSVFVTETKHVRQGIQY